MSRWSNVRGVTVWMGLAAVLAFGAAAPATADADPDAAPLNVEMPPLLPAPVGLTEAVVNGAGGVAVAERGGQVPGINAVSVNLRLGAMLSPNVKFAGGADVTFNSFHLAPNFVTRVDADAIVSANFGGVTTLVPLTVDEIYSHGMLAGTSIYAGVGVGPYFGSVTRFGGKILVGGTVTRGLGVEGAVQFPGFGDPLLTLEARLPL